MPDQPADKAGNATRTTGNDPIEGADPGGTRSTRPGNPDKGQKTPAGSPERQPGTGGEQGPGAKSPGAQSSIPRKTDPASSSR